MIVHQKDDLGFFLHFIDSQLFIVFRVQIERKNPIKIYQFHRN